MQTNESKDSTEKVIQEEHRQVSVKFLKEVLAEMTSMWETIDSEWGPTIGGLESDIANGRAPEIAELMRIIGDESGK